MTSINRDEWLAALVEVGVNQTHDPDSLTILEFAEMFSLNRQTADRRLKRLEAMGKAARAHKCAPGADGRMCWFVSYKLL